ncbi:MAG: DNA-binding protein WhiA [Clostridiales bacterium]|jgi:DNA-binding protein WhiA|nr:DNA-binding protein WhiA [Clostridiales bacterium]
MSFASDVKNEICKTAIEEICCARAELAGIVCFSAQTPGGGLRINTEHHAVAERVCALAKRLYHLSLDVTARESGIYTIRADGAEVIKILRDMRLAGVPLRIDKSVTRSGCCKRAFMRGAFLGGGSVSAPRKGYHLELVTGHYALCGDFAAVLEYFGIAPKIIHRKGNYVFYIKDSAQIEDFLAALGAHTQMMAFLNVKIEKEVRNVTNRRVNCENANAEKCAGAAVAQIFAIQAIDKKIGLEHLPPPLEAIARARLDDPEASLADLARALGISKSGANHRMRKITLLGKEPG